MARRLFALALAALITAAAAQAITLAVPGQEMYTLRYLWGGSYQYIPEDTTQSDTVWTTIVVDSSGRWWDHSLKLVSFPFPTSVADCDCLYFSIHAYNYSDSTWQGRNGLLFIYYTQDRPDASEFTFHPMGDWSLDYTLDYIPYGSLFEHRTLIGHDAYFQYILNRDHSQARQIIVGIQAQTWDRHLIVDATMYWTTDALAADPRPVPERFEIAVYPNPVSNGFSYRGPEATFTVFDILGRTVAAGSMTSGSWVPMPNAPPGAYFLRTEIPDAPAQTIRLMKLQ